MRVHADFEEQGAARPEAKSAARPVGRIDDGLVLPGRLARLRAELVEEGLPIPIDAPAGTAILVELAYALRPALHEGKAPPYGAVVSERLPDPGAGLDGDLVDFSGIDAILARRFADGLHTFILRDVEGITKLACLRRAVSGEAELMALRDTTGGTVIQRLPDGRVRVSCGDGIVVRWDGCAWHHGQRVNDVLDALTARNCDLPVADLRPLLHFALHHLSPLRVGATLVWRPTSDEPPHGSWEPLLPTVPSLRIGPPGESAAIAQVLDQSDGAAVFDRSCRLVSLGVRLVPSSAAQAALAPGTGTRHTSALRYTHDDRAAIAVIVSDNGPVSVAYAGTLIDGEHEDLIG